MFKRSLATIAAVAGLTGQALAQPAPAAPIPDVKTFTSSAEVAALIAKAKADHKPGQSTVFEPLLRLAPYRAALEYRAGVGPAAIHQHDAEVFYIVEGSGVLITGGKLTDPKPATNGNISGAAIEGGQSQIVSKGDFLIIPENTPHWFSKIDGAALVDMSLHVPRPVGP